MRDRGATMAKRSAAVAVLAVFLAATAAAQTPALIGENFRISDGVAYNIGSASAAFNSVDNEYRVIWWDERVSGELSVFARRVSPTADLLDQTQAIRESDWTNIDTLIAHNAQENAYLATWRYQGERPGTPGFNRTWGTTLSATGGPQTAIANLCMAAFEPTLVYNDVNNEYFLFARSFGAYQGIPGMYGMRINAAGEPLDGPIAVVPDGSGAPAGAMAFNPDANQYLATWRDQMTSNLKGRLINSDGTFATSAFVISPVFPASELAADVCYDPVNGRYLVVFGQFMGGPIRGQFVSAAGQLDGDPFTLVDDANIAPRLAYDEVNGVFLLVRFDGNTSSVLADVLDADGLPVGDTLVVADGTAWFAMLPRAVANPVAGGFLVLWTDGRESGNNVIDVYGQRIGFADRTPGDLNCDGSFDGADIDPFFLALGDPDGYRTQFPDCDPLLGDMNVDGSLDGADIDPFFDCLGGGNCP